MPILQDGTVVPNYLSVEPRGQSDHTQVFGNLALRQGEVLAIIYPDDPQVGSKKIKSTSYKVAVQHRDGSGPATTVTYPHCIVLSEFGGTADRSDATYRPRSRDPNTGEIIVNGSMVLILCVNGDTNRAYIIGGLPGGPVNSRSQGHNSYREFNGVSTTINNDGELRIQFRGATRADGTLMDGAGDNGLTSMSMLKDSSLQCDVGSTMTFNVKDKSFIKSAGLQIGAATDATMMGTTYRKAQAQLHQQLQQALTQVAAQLTLAAAAASGPLLTPVIGGTLAGPIIGPALTGAVAAITTMVSDLASFEAQASEYLSKINNSD